ncbi:MAG TPA: 50S ribosomal protein L20 [Candidatus Wirthbacteria bacterium]|nr:50S ribosomal protein L20 [Candidatus Wirthbacteria bacterium]
MTRVKRGVPAHKRHKKELKRAKGYRSTRHRLIKVAREANLHADDYAYVDRKKRKRDMRRLWVVRLNAAVREHDLTYSKFIYGLNQANITLNRKMLSELAIHEPAAFQAVVTQVKAAL